MTDSLFDPPEKIIEQIHTILKDNCKLTESWSVHNRIVKYRLHFIRMYVDKMIYGTSNDEVEKMFAEWHIPKLINEEKQDEWEE
tara:strand:+ start:7129 stop:7380 length:252 start_codon:yes stop_codon:yes gene_type:complete